MILHRLLIFAVLAGLLAACGIRGPLEPPPDSAQAQQSKQGDKKPEPKKNDEPFILDSIL
jgi:predicted small lipoprotein YifL